MGTPEQDIQAVRKKRTILLLVGGAASLTLPLLGVLYIKINEVKTARPPDSAVMFDRREGGEAKVSVSQTVTIINPAAQVASGPSSLDFIKGGANNTYFHDNEPAAATPAASTVTAPIAASAPKPAPQTAAKKGGKKAFSVPKLQGTKGFNSFKGASPKPTGGQGMTGVADPQAGKGDGDMSDLLKNVPGGASNPEVQKYLKSQGK